MRTVLPALAQAVVMNSSPSKRTVEGSKDELQVLFILFQIFVI